MQELTEKEINGIAESIEHNPIYDFEDLNERLLGNKTDLLLSAKENPIENKKLFDFLSVMKSHFKNSVFSDSKRVKDIVSYIEINLEGLGIDLYFDELREYSTERAEKDKENEVEL